MNSAFAKYEDRIYPHRWTALLHVDCLMGGIPTDPSVAEGWLKSKLASPDDIIREQVAEVMIERGLDVDEATEAVVANQHLCGFKRDESGLYIEGRNLKACLKEATQVAVAAGNLDKKGWGATNKGAKSFAAEHICVVEDRLSLGVTQPSRIIQSFIHKMTMKGPISAIQYNEVVEDVKISATIKSDFDYGEAQWAAIWLTAQEQGLGTARSQGFGRFTVTEWTKT